MLLSAPAESFITFWVQVLKVYIKANKTLFIPSPVRTDESLDTLSTGFSIVMVLWLY